MVLEDLFSFDSMMFKSKGDVLGVSIFFTIFTKGSNVCYFLFASLSDKMGV